jgi:hypothetical protein
VSHNLFDSSLSRLRLLPSIKTTDRSKSSWPVTYSAQLQSILSGTTLKIRLAFKPSIRAMSRFNVRIDEWDVDFEDPRDHAALRWTEIVLGACESLSSPADRQTVQEPREWDAVTKDIQEKASDPSYAQMRRTLLGLKPVPQTLFSLTSTFASALEPHEIEFNILWGLLFLNIKVSIQIDPLICPGVLY